MGRNAACIFLCLLLPLFASPARAAGEETLFGKDAQDLEISAGKSGEVFASPASYPNGQPIMLGSRQIASGHWVRDIEDVPGGRIVMVEVPYTSQMTPMERSRLDTMIQTIMRVLALKPETYLPGHGNSVANGTVRTIGFKKEMDKEKGVMRYMGTYLTEAPPTTETRAEEPPPPPQKTDPAPANEGYPNGEPVVRNGQTVVLRHYVRDVEGYENARIVYLAVPLNKNETVQQRLLRDRQIQLWMRSLAVNPRMFIQEGTSSASGTVRTVELKKEIDEAKGEIVYKGAFLVD